MRRWRVIIAIFALAVGDFIWPCQGLATMYIVYKP